MFVFRLRYIKLLEITISPGSTSLCNYWVFLLCETEIVLLGWFTAMIILHFHLQPQFKNELFHIYFTSERGIFIIIHGKII